MEAGEERDPPTTRPPFALLSPVGEHAGGEGVTLNAGALSYDGSSRVLCERDEL